MVKYSEKLLEYFYHCKHAGSLGESDNVYQAEEGSIEQGEVIRFYLQIENQQIEQVRFKSHGSVALIAACEFAAGWLEGRRLDEVSELTATLILNSLELSALYNHVAILVLTCVNKAIKVVS